MQQLNVESNGYDVRQTERERERERERESVCERDKVTVCV